MASNGEPVVGEIAMDDRLQAGRAAIERWYATALAAVEPDAAVRRSLRCDGRRITVDDRGIAIDRRLVVIAIGKAAVGMTRGAVAVCGEAIEAGIVITKDGHAAGDLPARFRVVEAAHPVPDQRGVDATRAALALVESLGAGDVLLALISGGGSALFEAPRPPLTLAEMAATTDLLLRAGAPIQDLNAVRTVLSSVKGGGLRAAAAPASVVTLVLSDVLGNDPRVIASGPTVAGSPDPARARRLLDRYRIADRVPASVLAALDATSSATTGEVTLTEEALVVVGDNATAVAAVEVAAAADGVRSRIAWREREGEAADLGRAWVEECLRANPDTDLILGGGEATVTVRGDGIGGRNTEFALSAALELARRGESGWLIASLATDGQDGRADVAGAIADGETAARASAAGIDPVAALRDNDSLRVFDAAGGAVRPGPTGTNVNDLYLGLRLVPRAKVSTSPAGRSPATG